MKTILTKFVLVSAIFGFVACNNSEKKTEEASATESGSSAAPATTEPKKTEVSVGPNGAEVKTKTGAEVKVDGSGGSVGNKDVKIKINTKDTTRKN
jgi:hypothetical protein